MELMPKKYMQIVAIIANYATGVVRYRCGPHLAASHACTYYDFSYLSNYHGTYAFWVVRAQIHGWRQACMQTLRKWGCMHERKNATLYTCSRGCSPDFFLL